MCALFLVHYCRKSVFLHHKIKRQPPPKNKKNYGTWYFQFKRPSCDVWNTIWCILLLSVNEAIQTGKLNWWTTSSMNVTTTEVSSIFLSTETLTRETFTWNVRVSQLLWPQLMLCMGDIMQVRWIHQCTSKPYFDHFIMLFGVYVI